MKILEMDYSQIKAFVAQTGQPAYRADQIMGWIAKGRRPEEMGNLPKSLVSAMEERGFGGVRLELAQASRDGSEKYLFRCEDGNAVEGVLMEYRHGGSLCLSTQAGCRMGCAFCASGENGLVRNLTVDELVGQVHGVIGEKGSDALNHMVLMGCGEPFDNYDNVVRFLRLVTQEKGFHFSCRNISLSTCGLVDRIYAFIQERLPVVLCISLHAPNDEVRHRIMPISHRYSIDAVVEAARAYDAATGRRVIFEYALVEGINDSPVQARELARLTRGMRKHINLIPLNGNVGGLRAPSRERCQRFLEVLRECGASATIRRTLAEDIEGACGQLRRRVLQEEG